MSSRLIDLPLGSIRDSEFDIFLKRPARLSGALVSLFIGLDQHLWHGRALPL